MVTRAPANNFATNFTMGSSSVTAMRVFSFTRTVILVLVSKFYTHINQSNFLSSNFIFIERAYPMVNLIRAQNNCSIRGFQLGKTAGMRPTGGGVTVDVSTNPLVPINMECPIESL